MIKIHNKDGHPAIDGVLCTYDTKAIRTIIQAMFEENNEFELPSVYGFELVPSEAHGHVAKIVCAGAGPVNTLERFEAMVIRHSYTTTEPEYTGLALSGEVGEVNNVVKKLRYKREHPDWDIEYIQKGGTPLEERLEDEMGDALFYWFQMAIAKRLDPLTIMQKQADKLAKQSGDVGRVFLK